MSSFLICYGPQAEQRLAALEPLLPPPLPHTAASRLLRPRLALRIVGTDADSGISEAAGIVLGFEGYLTHRDERGAALRLALIEDFRREGERCLTSWRGSFRLLLHANGSTRLYTDQLGSRRLFVGADAHGAVCASHAAPVLAALPRRTLDGANLMQFLNSGRFFAGATLLHELRQAAPGACLHLDSTSPNNPDNPDNPGSSNSAPLAIVETLWHRYRLAPEPMNQQEVMPELKRRLDHAVLRYRARAGRAALLLSGGYDARYILNTLAGHGACADRSGLLTTCLWGEPIDDPDCDVAWAQREAARHGLEFTFLPLRAMAKARFAKMFRLQSGMSTHVFTHTDDLVYCALLRRMGYTAVLRGDECFGPDGGAMTDVGAALARVGVPPLPSGVPWFSQPQPDWEHAHRLHLESLAAVADHPDDVRDILYCRERLPALHTHLNAQRAQWLETFSPLLDADVLDLARRFPRDWRTDKSMFRRCFLHHYPTAGFASIDNGFQWPRLFRQPGLANFVRAGLARLPAPFSQAFFHALGQKLGPPYAATTAEAQLAVRALVIGQWLAQAEQSGGAGVVGGFKTEEER